MFEALLAKRLTNEIGELTIAKALKMFPEPTERRTTEMARVFGWYFEKGQVTDVDLLLVSTSKSNQENFALVLGFTPDGLLSSFDFAYVRRPSSSFGTSSKAVVQIGISLIAPIVLGLIMERVLTQVSDHFVRNLQKIIPSSISTQGVTATGTVGNVPASINIPSINLQIK